MGGHLDNGDDGDEVQGERNGYIAQMTTSHFDGKLFGSLKGAI